MTKYTFELDSVATKIEMREFDSIAQIFVNDKLIAEYSWESGVGATKIYHAEDRQLINVMAALLYDTGKIEGFE